MYLNKMTSVLDFREQANVLTIGAVAGIFTWGLVITLKKVLIIPLFNAYVIHNAGGFTTSLPNKQTIVWGDLLVEFLIWILVIIILYLVWRGNREHHEQGN